MVVKKYSPRDESSSHPGPRDGDSKKENKCFNCGEVGHVSKYCRNDQNCFKCGKSNIAR